MRAEMKDQQKHYLQLCIRVPWAYKIENLILYYYKAVLR